MNTKTIRKLWPKNGAEVDCPLADKWINLRLQHVKTQWMRFIDTHRVFDLAAQALYEFLCGTNTVIGILEIV